MNLKLGHYHQPSLSTTATFTPVQAIHSFFSSSWTLTVVRTDYIDETRPTGPSQKDK